MINVGCCYKDGTGVEKDLVEAVRCYKLAADQGHAVAQINLGEISILDNCFFSSFIWYPNLLYLYYD